MARVNLARLVLEPDTGDALNDARVRYLSQQFVEGLYPASGMTDDLLAEIERVILEAHPEAERDNALTFESRDSAFVAESIGLSHVVLDGVAT